MAYVRVDDIPRTRVTEVDGNGSPVATYETAREGRVTVEYTVLDDDQTTVLYTSSWTGPTKTSAASIRDAIFNEVQRYEEAKDRMTQLDTYIGVVQQVPPYDPGP